MTKLKITIPELSRFSGIPEETNAMDYRSKHPGAF